ncbi:hypothetical protein [Corynebacterium halotolerans]|uniref:hypothetical protein n=1 Tax=Corynebacterium halotolerans TaxID=225326 RepID=UPI003CF3D3E0
MNLPSRFVRHPALVFTGAVVLTGCTAGDPSSGPVTTTAHTTVATAGSAKEPTPPRATNTDDATTATAAESDVPGSAVPGDRFVALIDEVPQIDPAPYSSSLIYPAQPGLQFRSPDGTYCEMYGEPGQQGEAPGALCTYAGEVDVNAVSVRQGEPAVTHNVNRIFTPAEQTRVLEPGSRLVDGAVSCAIPEGENRVLCAVTPYSFAVSMEDVALG